MSAPDGLEALQAQRARASARHAPPPRHTAPAKRPSAPVVDAPPPTARAAAKAAEPEGAGALVRASIYLDVAADGFLEDVRTAGRRASPKVDASRSAVVRLALLRLADDLGPAGVVAELSRRSAAAAVSPGRKRL
jgi:hypothetical protein